MCLIIVRPGNTHIDMRLVEDAWYSNPHGGGFAYNHHHDHDPTKPKNVWVFSTLDRKTFMASLEHAIKCYPQSTFIIHTRWATHGDRSVANIHPFVVGPTLAFAHNGIIPIELPSEERQLFKYGHTISDTYHLNESVLKKWYGKNPNFIHATWRQRELQRMIRTSKLAFVDATGKYVIINEQMGEWDGSLWFSNASHKKHRPGKTNDWQETHKRFNFTNKVWDMPYWDKETRGYLYPGASTDYIKGDPIEKPEEKATIDPLTPANLIAQAKVISNIGHTLESTQAYKDAVEWLDMEDYLLDVHFSLFEARRYHRMNPSNQQLQIKRIVKRGRSYGDPSVLDYFPITNVITPPTPLISTAQTMPNPSL